MINCRNLSLGLAIKARCHKVAGQEGNSGVTSHAPGVQRVWGNEPSHSQVNSHVGSWSPEWIPESLERNFRGQNSLPWRILYIIGKLLKLRCLKWARIAHLDIWNTSYGQKKGRKSNWQFDSRPLKVRNQPNSLVWWVCVTYHWKALDKGYNFALDLIAIEGLKKKLCAHKVTRVLIVAISGFPLRSLGTKSHLDVAPWRGAEYTIRGEVVASPKSRLWWVLCVQVARGSS